MYSTLEQVKIRLKQFHVETIDNGDGTSSDVVIFDNKEENLLIEQLIEQAIQDVKNRRLYPEYFTESQIDDDMKKFQSCIVNLAVYDYSLAGENFMQSYSENGINRQWKERTDLLDGIYPFVKFL